ncbi:glycine-rich cell wall structural protein 1 [Metarhizium rileyi]|uniref:Glycine-rich cell wall structural protein 1 n=1 Tax=Metarhizium rileyi (strain RCEF 4871) TaxID=1649241 RepID=A0A162JIM9_METRR|nr:glycine-rich cell wall structural protein 1 [Metarhizium rileyi RCEF 4871]
METISSIANTAAKVVWGDGTEHDEPASGVQGDVSKGEPYDGGNIDPMDQNRKETEHSTMEESEALNEMQDSKKRTEEAPSPPTEPLVRFASEPRKDSPQSGGNNSTVEGDGPRPLADIAKEHGGDAGNLQTGSEPTSAKGDDVNASHTKDGSSESRGTGEKYVETTGLAADGGDFDATKPGAGREADRLMEDKGVDRQGGVDQPKLDSSSSGSRSKDGKPSLKEKIKDKLHIHKS